MNKIIFVHGWGMAPDFWQPLIEELGLTSSHILNLGYSGAQDIAPPPNKSLYITHSYGTIWSLKHHEPFMSGLIAINGFTHFGAFTPAPILKAMRLRLAKEPEAQMQDFYKLVGHEAPLPTFNIEALKTGLDALAHDNVQEHLDFLDMPSLFLHGQNDPIVPLDKALDQTLGKPFEICEKGGHRLPVTHTKWCARHIRDFEKQ